MAYATSSMNSCSTEPLAQFCIAQHSKFDSEDWYMRFETYGAAIALAAKYLSMTSWYGNEDDLEHIAAKMNFFVESSQGLYREAQDIGFDLQRFSVEIRLGIHQSRVLDRSRTQNTDFVDVLDLISKAGADAERSDNHR